MLNKGSVRRKSWELLEKVIKLRKSGHSYGEIRKETGLAKSTINNWITYAGLNLSKEHLQIQAIKRVENHVIGTEASRITRARRKDEDIQRFILSTRKYFNDPFFVAGVMLYQAEGSKSTVCKFSNSDYRLIKVFVLFLERYFKLGKKDNMTFELYVHETRFEDLDRIKRFWSRKIGIPLDRFRVYWKKNKIIGRKENMDYVGQVLVRVHGVRVLGSKILTVSGIILSKHLR